MSGVTLYGYWRSSCAYRVRICLNIKGIKYETVAVNLLAGEHRTSDYLRINPLGQVPALLIDGLVMTQSLAIAQYLEQRNPDPPLLPGEPAEAMRVWSAAYAVAMEIQPVSNLEVVGHLAKIDAVPEQKRQDWMQHWMRRGFDALEQMANADGPFLCGEQCTLADVCLVPQMYNARRWNLDPAFWPRLARSDAACAKLDAFALAHPDRQPDAKH